MQESGDDSKEDNCCQNEHHAGYHDLVLGVTVTDSPTEFAIKIGRYASTKENRPHKVHKRYCTLKRQFLGHFGQRRVVRLGVHIRHVTEFLHGREGNYMHVSVRHVDSNNLLTYKRLTQHFF